MADQWTEVLRCSQCKHVGSAMLSHPESAEMPTVLGTSSGFKAVRPRLPLRDVQRAGGALDPRPQAAR